MYKGSIPIIRFLGLQRWMLKILLEKYLNGFCWQRNVDARVASVPRGQLCQLWFQLVLHFQKGTLISARTLEPSSQQLACSHCCCAGSGINQGIKGRRERNKVHLYWLFYLTRKNESNCNLTEWCSYTIMQPPNELDPPVTKFINVWADVFFEDICNYQCTPTRLLER